MIFLGVSLLKEEIIESGIAYSATEQQKKLSLFMFSQNHKMRFRKAANSEICPDLKCSCLLSGWGGVGTEVGHSSF